MSRELAVHLLLIAAPALIVAEGLIMWWRSIRR